MGRCIGNNETAAQFQAIHHPHIKGRFRFGPSSSYVRPPPVMERQSTESMIASPPTPQAMASMTSLDFAPHLQWYWLLQDASRYRLWLIFLLCLCTGLINCVTCIRGEPKTQNEMWMGNVRLQSSRQRHSFAQQMA